MGGIGITVFFHVYVKGSSLSIKRYLGCIMNLIIPFVCVEFWMFFGARPTQGTVTTLGINKIIRNKNLECWDYLIIFATFMRE